MTHMHDKQIKQTSIILWKVGCKLEEAFLIRKTHEPKVEVCLSAECSEHQVNKKGAVWCPSLTRHEHKKIAEGTGRNPVTQGHDRLGASGSMVNSVVQGTFLRLF